MAEDIVERLREVAGDGGGDGIVMMHFDLPREAADEIERLREKVSDYERIVKLANDNPLSDNRSFADIKKEIRNG